MSDLVIDADIMRAAGVSEHPVSSNARLILESIKSAGHRMVHTPAIIKEHKRHQSRFARTWRASMFSRKLHAPKNASEDAELRKHLVHAQNVESPNDETAVLKDAHLLEAAAASDMRVLSKDTTAKRLFQKAVHCLNHTGESNGPMQLFIPIKPSTGSLRVARRFKTGGSALEPTSRSKRGNCRCPSPPDEILAEMSIISEIK